MKIIASLATHPSRYPKFAETVATLLPQVDKLIICVNPVDDGGGGHLDAGMVLDAIREERGTRSLEDRMYIYVPPQDLGDSGKFYVMTGENARDWGVSHGEPAWDMFLICDDDNLYPPSFARDMREALHRYAWGAVVGLHGKVLRPPVLSYHGDRTNIDWHHFSLTLSHDVAVNLLSTNIMAIPPGLVTNLAMMDFPHELWNQADMHFGQYAATRGIPLVCIAHDAGYVKLSSVDQRDSIWVESQTRGRVITDFVNSHHWPIHANKMVSPHV